MNHGMKKGWKKRGKKGEEEERRGWNEERMMIPPISPFSLSLLLVIQMCSHIHDTLRAPRHPYIYTRGTNCEVLRWRNEKKEEEEEDTIHIPQQKSPGSTLTIAALLTVYCSLIIFIQVCQLINEVFNSFVRCFLELGRERSEKMHRIHIRSLPAPPLYRQTPLSPILLNRLILLSHFRWFYHKRFSATNHTCMHLAPLFHYWAASGARWMKRRWTSFTDILH